MSRTIHCARFSTPVTLSLRRVCTVSPTRRRCSPHPPRGPTGLKLALVDAPLLDRVVNGIRLSVGAGHQRHAFAARVPFEVGVDHPLTGGVTVVDPHDMAALGELARDRQRSFAIARFTEPQRECRVLRLAEPVNGIELHGRVRIPDRRSHRPRVPDRERLVRVTDERDSHALLERELDENVRRLQAAHAGLVDHDPMPRPLPGSSRGMTTYNALSHDAHPTVVAAALASERFDEHLVVCEEMPSSMATTRATEFRGFAVVVTGHPRAE